MPNQLDGSTVPANDRFLTQEGLVSRVWINFLLWLKKTLVGLLQGPQRVTQAQIAATQTNLRTNDVGKLIWVTDFNHVLRWTGSGWQFAPGYSTSGYYVLFEVVPTEDWWHVADGSVNVTYLKGDGTLGTVATLQTIMGTYFRR